MAKIKAFIQLLQKQPHSQALFNPYLDANLANNLEHYLRMMRRQQGRKTLLVGEAPGYLGCRLTGVPFSSCHLILNSEHVFLSRLNKRVKLQSETKETSAQTVWQYLLDKKTVPLFWNAFPYHPHKSKAPKTNRKPNASEIRQGVQFLEALDDIFKVEKVASLGRAGLLAAQLAFPQSKPKYIRHPSYGGKKDFIKGMNSFLNETH
ncbi:MAG: uracil-DNA glycosylase [Candidatus Azotimanducaceae bacterium]|jgi:uracil-DNA glycosylase